MVWFQAAGWPADEGVVGVRKHSREGAQVVDGGRVLGALLSGAAAAAQEDMTSKRRVRYCVPFRVRSLNFQFVFCVCPRGTRCLWLETRTRELLHSLWTASLGKICVQVVIAETDWKTVERPHLLGRVVNVFSLKMTSWTWTIRVLIIRVFIKSQY